ncbi:MAG: ABC transporter permease [Hyphomicrobium sp. SCN 65-11]|nr:MAG: ABC transporter permease [Hyphomicrobium sp. SCN 65-11]
MADVAIANTLDDEAVQPARRAQRRGVGRFRLPLTALVLLLPAVFLMMALLIGPVAAVMLMSFTDYQLGAPSWSLVGLTNYVELYGDRVFWTSLVNTLFYVAVVVPASMALGLGLALLIESGTTLRGFYRSIFFIPVMATLIAMAISWEYMLHPQFGLINLTLKSLGLPAQAWLTDPALALPTIAVIGIWQLFGFNMVLFLAGLVSIPSHLYEAAVMDGARSAWSRFWLVTWPMLGPVTMFVAVISAIRSFQVFDTVHVLTKGGPSKATEVLLYSMYSEGFEFFRSGLAAAIAVVFLAFVLLLTVIKSRLIEQKVHYA